MLAIISTNNKIHVDKPVDYVFNFNFVWSVKVTLKKRDHNHKNVL